MLCTSPFVVSLSNHERTQSSALSGSCRSPFDAAQGERGLIQSFLNGMYKRFKEPLHKCDIVIPVKTGNRLLLDPSSARDDICRASLNGMYKRYNSAFILFILFIPSACRF